MELWKNLSLKFRSLRANPTILSRLVGFENKNIFFSYEKCSSLTTTGAEVANSKVQALAPGWIRNDRGLNFRSFPEENNFPSKFPKILYGKLFLRTNPVQNAQIISVCT
jgi:hypothetical protein